MDCTFTYPRSYSVLQAFWTKHWIRGAAPPNLLGDPEYRGRAQYLGDKYRYCTLRLRDVTEKDQSKYYFTFITRTAGRTHQGEGGVELSVTGLQVEVPERVMEGGKVTLTCKTTCSLTVRPTFTWYRGGRRLSSSTDQLHLQPVSREDAGGYHCAVLDQNLHSPEVTLNVRYGPKSVSVSISPSGEIVEGSSVTLTCSSDANPPVDCTWFKGTSLLVRGETYTLKKISSVDSGGYRCRCSNEHGEKDSEAVSLNVLYLRVEVPERVVEGNNVTLTCKTSFRLSDGPTFTWYRNGHPLSSSTDQVHLQPVSREDAGGYHCAALGQNLRSPEVTLNVRHGPKSVSVSISPSGEIVEGSLVTLTCSSDANPPVNCTWFKETSLLVRGETYTLKVSSVDSAGYRSVLLSSPVMTRSLTAGVLSFLDPPKSVSVSISPSGEILEGSSVTLTCSSDANPPVQSYTWFKKLHKEALLKSTSQIYIISNISSTDSGEYQCMANNTQGSRSSEYKTLTVLYATKKVLVSISDTAEVYSYSPLQNGSYYCVAQNEYGSQKSAAVTVTVKGSSTVLYVVVGVGLCGVAAVTAVMLLIRRKRKKRMTEIPDYQDVDPNAKDDTYTALQPMSRSDDVYNTLSNTDPNAKDDTYTALDPRSRSPDDVYNTLTVEVPERVMEGGKVTLTCNTTCSLTVRPTFTWYRDGRYLSSSTDQLLHLQPVSREDAGRYHCSAQDRNSTGVTLNVRYPPKSVSVSISPSGEILGGSSVTLTCSSDANPPVQSYTWFKEGGDSPVGSGSSYSPLQNGSYNCVAQNEYGSQKSAAVTVTVKAGSSTVLYVVVGVGLCGVAAVTAVMLLIRRKRKKRTTEQPDCLDVDPNAKDDTYTALQPMSRSDDVYNTLSDVDPNAKDDTYTALDPRSRSPDDVYNTLTVAMVTSLSCTVPLVFLLFILGVVAQDGLTVTYLSPSYCVLKDDSVYMYCTYTYPSNHTVLKAFWTKEPITSRSEPPDLLADPEYKDRFQDYGDKHGDCSFRLKNVREKDQSKYYFTVTTDPPGGRYQGEGGVDLSVTDLQLEVPERVIEGGKVTLTCKTTCSLTVRPTFTWYRDGHNLSTSIDQLHLQPVRREDAGRYHCSVLDQKSPEVTLNVRYAPKSVSVSISPSGEIVEGSSVTLTCSSDADPPVNCTWFNGTSLVVRGETYTVQKISSVDSGGYRCRCGNEHGEKDSEAVSLNVLYPPRSVSVSISPAGYIVEGSSVTLTCSSDANPPVQSYTWFKGASLVAEGKTYTMEKISSVDSGGYRCRCSNEYGVKDSEAVTLNVLYLRVEVPERVMEGNNATLTCKTSFRLSDKPTFTWYRNGHPLSSSTDQLLQLQPVSREDAGRYHCAVLDQNLRSPNVTLNVRHGPKSVSVSISPSGEIVVGSSVTLTCSSDADPPVNCTWFNGTSLVVRGETYTLKVSSVDRGVYRCRCSNGYIEKYSEAVSLNVLYPPKSVSVSISPSGEIVEGSSVTLTCSSDANPPVQNYTWFKKLDKEALLKSTSQIYIMSDISSADSGGYQCMAENTQGSRSSEYRTLTVLLDGSSVTLTCSSDANPPVQNYTWFKEGGDSPVGSGSSYSPLQNGSYYCVAQNEYGSQKSAAVTVTVKAGCSTVLYVVVGVGLCGVAAVTAVMLLIRKRKKRMTDQPDYQDVDPNAKDDMYTALHPMSRSSDDVYNTLSNADPNAKDDTYTALDPRSRSSDDVYNTLTVAMVTSLSCTVPLVFLLFILGVVAQDGLTVKYISRSFCVLKDDSVNMECTYTYPSNHTVLKAFWTKEPITSRSEPPDLLADPEYKDRFQYHGDKQGGCSFRLKYVREKDQSKYYFTVITDRPGGRYQGEGGVDLSVTGLQVEVPERVMEGGNITLTCKTTCSLTSRPTFTWYRDGRPLSSSTDQLHLQPVRREDAGRYHCAVLDQKSPEVTLNVRYAPKSVSVSISPSGEIVEGSSVTLTCSSDADPPVNCTWFKETSLVVRGETYTLKKISSVDSGGYRCRCGNEHGEKDSEAVTLNVLYPPRSVSVSISPAGYIVEGSSVTLTCSSDANPPVQNYTWFNGTSLVVKGETYTVEKISSVDSGGYRCRCSNEYGVKDSEAVTLNVLYLRVEVPERVVEGNNVTLTCKTSFILSDGPTFTWYRNGHRLSSSTDQLLHLQPVSREDAGRYHCAVLDQNLHSPNVTLNVRYGPKNVSVSISPSGEIVEGSSVTLTCSSDADPPVNCTWFKGTSLVVRGETYTLKVSSVDSGGYRCRCSNGYIEKYSEAVSLNVLYPPKSISVSISPSGEIVEGSSVTMTCSSDANPPVQSYTWFKKLDKEALLKSTSQIYIISNISSADSGEYQCMANNTQGSRSSEYRTLTVLYAPKKVQVSNNTAEGSSVTLTCHSDANPPVNCTWYKEGGDSPVASGHSYNPLQSGSYYCVAQNGYGSQKSAAVTVTVKDVTDEERGLQHIVLGGIAGVVAVILFACIAVFCICVVFRKANNPRNAESSAVTASNLGADEEVQYASIQHRRDKVVEKTEGDDVQYASVRFIRPGATSRPAVSTHEDVSVIYSTLK
ncbi:hypothetical protein NFI96_023844 [Prochilodus magdalenae]|nr:hypothetical protein NFI96_023844 [Prochilodus magdalenae]